MILAQAWAIAQSEGAEALTARRLASGIGYSPGTLYQVFENLDDIVAQLKGRILDRLLEELDAAPRTGEPGADVERLVDVYLDFAAEHPRLWHALFELPLPGGSGLPDWLLARIAAGLERVERALVPYFASADSEDCRLAARSIWAALHGIVALARNGRLDIAGGQPARAMAHHLVGAYLAGLGMAAAAQASRKPGE